jgi:hypothetical protein
MNDSLYHYIDPEFSHQQVNNYKLLLMVNEASFSLAIMHRNKLMVWRKPAPLTELNQPGEVQEVLNFGYHEVITGINSPYFTLIAESLFNADQVKDVARYLDVAPADVVYAQPLDAFNHVVFKVPESLSQALNKFDVKQAVFGASGWIQAIEANQPSANEVYLNLHEGRVEIAHFDKGRLNLFNTFEFTHEEELAYYAVFVCQQLKLDLHTLDIKLSGDIAPGDERYQHLLQNIFGTVSLNTLAVTSIPERLPQHQLLALTALTLCASLADA